MRASPARKFWHNLRAGWRDTLLLLGEFRFPLLWFTLAMIGSGLLYYHLSSKSANPLENIAEGIYVVITMTFLQSSEAFPSEWYLEIFFFVMPVIGIGILAQGLADFGILLFNRRLRGKEWEMAVASTFSQHIVLIGLGHLGYRVVMQLNEMGREVVVIELSPKPDLLENVRKLGVPVIEDDGTREAVMVSAGIPRAHAIILCTQDDSLNLRMALKARSLNPNIEVIIRIFDNDFATSLQSQFGFKALSATGMAAPLFAALGANVDITPPIMIEGQAHILGNFQITAHSKLNGKTVSQVEEQFKVSIVLLCVNGSKEFHPQGTHILSAGQTVAIFGIPQQLNQLMHENR